MLEISIKAGELWLPDIEEFVKFPSVVLRLEHSLAAIAKWESKWKKPFFSGDGMEFDMLIDYIRCMTLNEVPDEAYYGLKNKDVAAVQKYMEDTMTATWFTDDKKKKPGKGRPQKVITAELIYWTMFNYGVPLECENWHINRLMVLLRVFAEKESGGKKMSMRDIMGHNTRLNAARRALTGSRG